MNEVDKHLDELLDIQSETITEDDVEATSSEVIVRQEDLLPAPIVEPVPSSERDLEYDYELSRETHRELLEQGKVALDRLMEVANESQHPRAYEVAGQLLKNLSDMTDKLMILHEKKKKIESDGNTKTAGNVNVDKAVFVGTTAELLKRVKHESNE
jgi:hypothetical protein